METPDDFGMNPAETLGHVGSPATTAGHGVFWNRFLEEVWSARPFWREADDDFKATCGDEGVTHSLESIRHVRIGARIEEPEGEPVGAALALHGYGGGSRLEERAPWQEAALERGLVVCKMRVRGFPGSQADTGDWRQEEFGWVGHGLDDAAACALRGAVADVVQGLRALREHVGAETSLGVHGESFGGGLAILALAQLMGKVRVSRLALGLPTLGDWEWRLHHAHRGGQGMGLGADVMRAMEAAPDRAEKMRTTLRLFDAVAHARAVTTPVVCKLAERDEVVPAPSAAAVYNALGTAAGEKWRFVVGYGHFDGGVADLRRHAAFERVAARFLDSRESPGKAAREEA